MVKSKQKKLECSSDSNDSSSSSTSTKRGLSSTPGAKKQKIQRNQQKEVDLKTLTLLRVQVKGEEYKQGIGTARTILEEVTKLVQENDSLKAEVTRLKQSSIPGSSMNPCCREKMEGMKVNFMNFIRNDGLIQLASGATIPASEVDAQDAKPAERDLVHLSFEDEYGGHQNQAVLGEAPGGFGLKTEECNNGVLSNTVVESNSFHFQSQAINETEQVQAGVTNLSGLAPDLPGQIHITELETVGSSLDENGSLDMLQLQQVRQVMSEFSSGIFTNQPNLQEPDSTEQSQLLVSGISPLGNPWDCWSPEELVNLSPLTSSLKNSEDEELPGCEYLYEELLPKASFL